MAWQIKLAGMLVALSVCTYWVQIYIFDNPHDTFFYLLEDLAFVPIQVLMVSVLLNEVLSMREKKAFLRKMNMVIGVFFSDTGTQLLRLLYRFDAEQARLGQVLVIDGTWSDRHYQEVASQIAASKFTIRPDPAELAELKAFLTTKKDMLVGLLGNPNLLEHDRFTELMWAVSHLLAELEERPAFDCLPAKDLEHLGGDIQRAYRLLLQEWLAYMRHLRSDYPYLFSLAIRTNPFKAGATAIIS